jgi:hypothetical protein
MVFARNALASGPGNAWNSIQPTPTWRKVKGGKTKAGPPGYGLGQMDAYYFGDPTLATGNRGRFFAELILLPHAERDGYNKCQSAK